MNYFSDSDLTFYILRKLIYDTLVIPRYLIYPAYIF